MSPPKTALYGRSQLLYLQVFVVATNSSDQFQGWTAEPNTTTGTASVIWECITTIGLCTYVVVHVNISAVRLDEFATFLRKCIVVFIGVVFPEVWAWGAVSQLFEARRLVKASRRLGQAITLKQAFFIYSGGIAIRDLQQSIPSAKAADLMGHKVSVGHKSLWHRNFKKELSDGEILMFASNVPSDEEIKDKSKQDTLVKIITSLQALWFVIQMAARGQQGLVIAPMQIGTLAYVSMAAFIYGCWWQKAYDVSVPSVLDGQLAAASVYPNLESEAWFAAGERSDSKVRKFFSGRKILHIRFVRILAEAMYQAGKASFYDVYHIVSIGASQTMTLGALTSIFTAVHIAAWNYEFPTPVEGLLWRILTTGGILLGPWAFIENTRLSSGDWWRSKGKRWAWCYIVYEALWGLFSMLYLLSRLYVMAESFIAFRHAPSSVYQQVNWSAYVPHSGA